MLSHTASGNRLQIIADELSSASPAFSGVKELELDETLMSWDEICQVTKEFKSLMTLTASSNALKTLTAPLTMSILTSLTLEYNDFTMLSNLSPLSQLSSLETLLLKGNHISAITSAQSESKPIFDRRLRYVDISHNEVTSWDFVDDLVEVFPGMTALRFSHNPVYASVAKESGSLTSMEESYMLTLARLRNLKTLNFSNISAAERTNAEMYYLSRIGKANIDDLVSFARHMEYPMLSGKAKPSIPIF